MAPAVPTTGLEPVRPFEHWSLKPACLPIPARGHPTVGGTDTAAHAGATSRHVPAWTAKPGQCSGRDSNPHGVNPHRILNPARLPIPPPERDGAEGIRTPDLLNAIQALSQLSYGPQPAFSNNRPKAGLTGLEPAASGVTDRHSNRTELQPQLLASPGTLGSRAIPSRGIEPRSPP